MGGSKSFQQKFTGDPLKLEGYVSRYFVLRSQTKFHTHVLYGFLVKFARLVALFPFADSFQK